MTETCLDAGSALFCNPTDFSFWAATIIQTTIHSTVSCARTEVTIRTVFIGAAGWTTLRQVGAGAYTLAVCLLAFFVFGWTEEPFAIESFWATIFTVA